MNHEEAWDWGDPDFSPYYHSTNDLLTYVGPDFTVGNIRIGVAALPVALQGGRGTATWNAIDGAAREIGACVYFAKLEGISVAGSVKLVYVR